VSLSSEQAREERAKRVAAMPEAERAALKSMKVVKFYPQNTFPDIQKYKVQRSGGGAGWLVGERKSDADGDTDAVCEPLLWQGHRTALTTTHDHNKKKRKEKKKEKRHS
jgi:hypothetical protein